MAAFTSSQFRRKPCAVFAVVIVIVLALPLWLHAAAPRLILVSGLDLERPVLIRSGTTRCQ